MRDAILLETSGQVEELAASLAGEPLVAVDTEADSFHSYFEKVCLVQISTRVADYIVDPLGGAGLEPLGPILADPAVTCVLHGADYDIRILDRDHGLTIRGLFDTMVAARLLGYPAFGLSNLLERHFGIRIPKANQRADWSRRPLTDDLLRYAATDTHYLPALRDALLKELDRAGRTAWAEEEFALLEQVRHQPREPDPEAYRRIKGARVLDRRGLAILRELFDLREMLARDRDRAPFRVLGNAALLSLAERRPPRPRDLRGIPGLPRSLSSDREGDLLAAVRRGVEAPEEALPDLSSGRPSRRPALEPAVVPLKRARDEAAKRAGLDPGLTAPNALLAEIARTRPRDREALRSVDGIRRWQVELLGEELLAALAGAQEPGAAERD